MATFTAKMKYADIRVITIEADTIEEAEARYAAGDWDSEDTIDFYADEEILRLAPAKGRR
jgi:hypothetical protein